MSSSQQQRVTATASTHRPETLSQRMLRFAPSASLVIIVVLMTYTMLSFSVPRLVAATSTSSSRHAAPGAGAGGRQRFPRPALVHILSSPLLLSYIGLLLSIVRCAFGVYRNRSMYRDSAAHSASSAQRPEIVAQQLAVNVFGWHVGFSNRRDYIKLLLYTCISCFFFVAVTLTAVNTVAVHDDHEPMSWMMLFVPFILHRTNDGVVYLMRHTYLSVMLRVTFSAACVLLLLLAFELRRVWIGEVPADLLNKGGVYTRGGSSAMRQVFGKHWVWTWWLPLNVFKLEPELAVAEIRGALSSAKVL